jgi:hypothetical protein
MQLLKDDIRESVRIALELAIPPAGRYDTEELRRLYGRMKELAVAA